MKYLTKFKTQEEYNDYSKSPKADLKRRISLVGAKVVYDNENEPFYIEAIDDIIIDIVTLQNYEYSFDTIVWNSIADILNVPAGDKVYLRPKTEYWEQIHVTGNYNVGGKTYKQDNKGRLCHNIFENEIGLISAEKLVLHSGGSKMFKNCTNLIKAPRILSKRHGKYWECYNMFQNCINLTESPVIIWDKEYNSNGGSYNAYRDYMFDGCSNLNKIIFIKTPVSDSSKSQNWTRNVSLNGVFITNNLTIYDQGNSIPTGWETKVYDTTNDTCYVRFFQINNASNARNWYTSDDNMTWAEWVLSKHNTRRWTVNDTNVLESTGKILMLGDTPVAPTDIVKRIVGSDYEFKTPTETTES